MNETDGIMHICTNGCLMIVLFQNWLVVIRFLETVGLHFLNKLRCESTTNPVPVLHIAASRGFSELAQNWTTSSHGHSTPSLKISCKSVQPFSRNLANKERKKERYIYTYIQTNKEIDRKQYPRPPICQGRGNNNCNICSRFFSIRSSRRIHGAMIAVAVAETALSLNAHWCSRCNNKAATAATVCTCVHPPWAAGILLLRCQRRNVCVGPKSAMPPVQPRTSSKLPVTTTQLVG